MPLVNLFSTHTLALFTLRHFFGWSKLGPGWLNDEDVRYIPRPPAAPDPAHEFNEEIPLYLQETDTDQREVIQIGTTPGVNERVQELVSYFVEARAKSGD